MSAPVPRVIRPMTRLDFLHLCRVVDSWWNDQVRYLLHPLYLEHFPQTCFVCEEAGDVAGFLVGFISQGRPEEAYVHLVGTAPASRGQGIGRALYEHFFEVLRSRGCVRCWPSPCPWGSLAFHRQMGFRFQEGRSVVPGRAPGPRLRRPRRHCVIMGEAGRESGRRGSCQSAGLGLFDMPYDDRESSWRRKMIREMLEVLARGVRASRRAAPEALEALAGLVDVVLPTS